jgi:hypothetical protein
VFPQSRIAGIVLGNLEDISARSLATVASRVRKGCRKMTKAGIHYKEILRLEILFIIHKDSESLHDIIVRSTWND